MSINHAISNDPMYQLLRAGKVAEFNEQKKAGESYNLRGCDFSSFDLRELDAVGLDLRDAYFRQADLRGVDLRDALLDGCSINAAKISGTYFPFNIPAQEILLSLEHGTRLRVMHEDKDHDAK